MIEADRPAPALSIVVVSYNMARELPRTLRSLSPGYQRGMAGIGYEVVLVDNGSSVPPVLADFADLGLDLRILHCDVRSPSPAAALNQGLAACRGALIGVIIDGARMASPGLLAAAVRAARLHDRPIVFTQSLMLGRAPQWQAHIHGYDQAAEDALLAEIGWPENAARLFEIATWPTAVTGDDRWFAPGFESNAVFMPRSLWSEVGGYDTAFQSPGGGCLSPDLFIRACALPDTQLVVIAGEATFHQMHSDSASTAHADAANQTKAFSREYYRIRKRAFRAPDKGYWLFRMNPEPPGAGSVPVRKSADRGAMGERYIALLKQVLLNEHGLDIEARLHALENAAPDAAAALAPEALQRVLAQFARGRAVGVTPAGSGWPAALTMIGRRRLDNLAFCVERVIAESIPGDLMECGVWRGGAALLMAGIVAAHDVRDRTIWLADSFAGLPPADPERDGMLDSASLNDSGLAVSLAEVQANFARFGLLDDHVRFLPGWFADTLPTAPVERLAVLRLDGDFYESTMTALVSLYDKLVPGGFLIVDDYGCIPSCAQAVEDFRKARGIAEPISKIDWTGVYWRKA